MVKKKKGLKRMKSKIRTIGLKKKINLLEAVVKSLLSGLIRRWDWNGRPVKWTPTEQR